MQHICLQSLNKEVRRDCRIFTLVFSRFPIITCGSTDNTNAGAQSRICGSILQDTRLDDRLANLISHKEGSITLLKKSIPNLVKTVEGAKRRCEEERDPLAKIVAQSTLKRHEELLAEVEAQLVHDKKVLELAKKVVPFKKRAPKVRFRTYSTMANNMI